MKKILMTGGGSAGHVTPNIALIKGLKEHGFEIHYAGLADGIEHRLISAVPGVNRVLWDISEKPVAPIEWE